MGIINATPDSFSDGGRYDSVELAVQHGLNLIEQGADILDIGGESSRPGADSVTVDQEVERVIPVIQALVARTSVPLSIDTCKPEVMRLAVESGASMINDINGLRADGAVEAAASADVPICIMHMQGQPGTMQTDPMYENVVSEVESFFKQRLLALQKGGVAKEDVILDPGIGFGKTLEHNLTLLNSLPRFRASTGCDLLIGVSRKSMIGELLNRSVEERLPASLGLAVQSVINGAKIVRVHDVLETHDAVRVVEAVYNS